MGLADSKDKELPKEPGGGRSRSGTGKSSNNKKSMFGVLSGALPVFVDDRSAEAENRSIEHQ